MYRQYEDPYKVEKLLEDAKERLEKYKLEMRDESDIEGLIDLTLEVESLKDRVRFAWDDLEYDETYSS